jgi:hypothetical protein
MRMKSGLTQWASLVVLASVLPAGMVMAAVPGNLSDIAYQDVQWGGDQLRARGYTLISSHRNNGKNYQFWWRDSANSCVQAVADKGKYEDLKSTTPTDCNQYHQSATKGSDEAAAAVAAAAILGAIALSHKSHEREGSHNDSQSMSEFERGYRDGTHHERFHNRNDSRAYTDGYEAGQRERDVQTSYRSDSGYYSGNQRYVSVEDLKGASGSGADSQMRSRGFRDTGGYKQDGKSFTTWYNGATRQCVQLVTREGEVRHVNSLDEGNCL